MKNNYLKNIFLLSTFVNVSISSAEASRLNNEYDGSATFSLEIITPKGEKISTDPIVVQKDKELNPKTMNNTTWTEFIRNNAFKHTDNTITVKISVKPENLNAMPCLFQGKQDIPIQALSEHLNEDKYKELDAKGILSLRKIQNLFVLLTSADPDTGHDTGWLHAQCKIYESSQDMYAVINKIRATKK